MSAEVQVCFPSLGEPCGNCHRCTDLAATTRAAELAACDVLKPALKATDRLNEAADDLLSAFSPVLRDVTALTERVAALTAALDAITAACTSALADHRRGCPTYGLVSAGLIAAIAEEAKG